MSWKPANRCIERTAGGLVHVQVTFIGYPLSFGSPADYESPVALRPHLAVGLPLSLTCSGWTPGALPSRGLTRSPCPDWPPSRPKGDTARVDFTRSAASADRPSGRTDLTPPWRRFVATGDSFTEGLWDVPDVGAGAPAVGGLEGHPGVRCRGWADLLAAHLAERVAAAGGAEPVRYANLAVRGRLLRPILDEQVPAAVALGPDLVSVVGGGNDLLRPGADPDVLADALDAAVAGVRRAGADVLLATGFDTVHSPVIRRTRGRTAVFNAHIWTIARRHDAHVLDMWGMRSLHDWRMWADDRIHLTSDGHRRVAQAALVALGLPPDDERWDDPLAPLPPLPLAARVRADAVWLRTHASPWVSRRMHGRSSGDGLAPKRPELEPVAPLPRVRGR